MSTSSLMAEKTVHNVAYTDLRHKAKCRVLILARTNLSQHDFTTCSQLHNFTTSSQLHNFTTSSQLQDFTSPHYLYHNYLTLLGYSQNSKTYIILNKHTRKIEESLNVTFNETPPPSKTSPLVDDDLDEEEEIKVTEKKNLENDIENETLEIDEIVNIKESRNHPLENVIGNLNQRTLRSQAQNQSNFFCFISTIEAKNVNEALTNESWIIAMQEELNQFIANDVWELVAQGYNQQEGIDYDETYAPIARLESIRILLAYACALDFKLFQMDVKSAFLNGFINVEFVIENLFFSYTLEEFAQILDIPCEGACVFTDKWSLDDLAYSVPRDAKPQSSPPTSNDTPSPQPSNPFLDNIMDAPPRPSYPTPIQSHPSLDITLSLSPTTPLDQILDTSSPPSPQPPP
ncbi:retrovirus-related pol polyprotein from transposon TNT 1-94 [Tanacetum coccineum]|uniref:Retrovirus-related pol polyprotein from transposon TNT 1-94 n=1 Tax=Tanacetum coccineum TaxID=301880 RepID=A0ABQ5BIZ1_9ASTR